MVTIAIGVGLSQAALFGYATSVLPPHRLSTGSGVLNMSRQIGLALGVSVLVALLGAHPDLHDFQEGFVQMIAAGVLGAGVAALLPGQAVRTSLVGGSASASTASSKPTTELVTSAGSSVPAATSSSTSGITARA